MYCNTNRQHFFFPLVSDIVQVNTICFTNEHILSKFAFSPLVLILLLFLLSNSSDFFFFFFVFKFCQEINLEKLKKNFAFSDV